MKKLLLAITVLISLIPINVTACITFFLDNNGETIVGKNTDSMPMPTYILINKRNVAKTAIPSAGDPAVSTWVSKYGSITFHEFAQERPFEGMNEAGLVVIGLAYQDDSYKNI
jgi:penicillin V acylase-like amidase (Ntn superfamily)